MANISASAVKELRELTGAGMMDCKRALEEAGGDLEKAQVVLREKGLAAAAKKAGREASEGIIDSYIHLEGRIGVLVEVNCETDFVAKNNDFKAFVHDIAMHIAASSPQYLKRDAVPAEVIEQERQALAAQARAEGKPDAIVEKMVEGRLNKFFAGICLEEQPFVKDPDMTIAELVKSTIARIGENIQIRRYVRYEMGEEL